MKGYKLVSNLYNRQMYKAFNDYLDMKKSKSAQSLYINYLNKPIFNELSNISRLTC